MEKKNQGRPSQDPKPVNSNTSGNDHESTRRNQSTESNPDDFGDDPEKNKEIGDDPDGTQKKIPRMSN